MKNPKFTIFTGNDDQFYFRLTASNGEPILASEGYTSKDGCENGIQSVKANAADDDQYERLQAADGQFYFKLLAKNNQVIGISEMYKSKQGRDNGIDSVKTNAPKAPVEDTSE